MSRMLVIVLGMLALVSASSATSTSIPPPTKHQPPPQAQVSKTPKAKHSCSTVKPQIESYRLEAWHWQRKAGQPTTRASQSLHRASCPYLRWVRDLWWKRKVEARLSYFTLPNTNDWVTAVRIVQRVYPGTSSRLLSISDREGGRGLWVWYGGDTWHGYHIGNDFLGDDTVGGWLQYRYSTFIGHWHGAVKDLRRRGYHFPDLGWARPRVKFYVGTGYGPWLSPLGQALAGGWAHWSGNAGCHWC